MVQAPHHHNLNLLTRWMRMLTAASRDWSVFQQIFADHCVVFPRRLHGNQENCTEGRRRLHSPTRQKSSRQGTQPCIDFLMGFLAVFEP